MLSLLMSKTKTATSSPREDEPPWGLQSQQTDTRQAGLCSRSHTYNVQHVRKRFCLLKIATNLSHS